MIPFWLFAVLYAIVVITGIIVIQADPDSSIDLEMTLTGIFFLSVLVIIVSGALVWSGDTETFWETEEAIYSIEAREGIEGAFVLGFGGVESNVKYYSYVLNEDGYILKSFNATDTPITSVKEGEKAHVVTTFRTVNLTRRNWLFGGLIKVEDHNVTSVRKNVLYLPADYIKERIQFGE